MEKIKKIIQPVLRVFGYYKIKSKIRWCQFLARLEKGDAARKTEALAWIEAIDHRILPDIKKDDNVTISLTSHGKRVADFAPFAIYSIFQQTVLPNRIVLNINREKWNEDNIPELIKKLQIAGLEVNFCEDVGPHTKLLPTLQKYPDDIIITVDDDKYYGVDLVHGLLGEYRNYAQKCVICREGRVVKILDGAIQPYSQWKTIDDSINDEDCLSPYGVGGVLYAPHTFSEEIFNKEVYRVLCPYADDIWFTVMEIREHIPVYRISQQYQSHICVNHTNEYEVQNSDALHFRNDQLGENNVQLSRLVEYYNLNEYFKA